MAGGVAPAWPVEEIPDTDRLYMRVHRTFVRDGEIRAGCFKNLPNEEIGGMSTDWSKYASPEETRGRGSKSPSEYSVIELDVGAARLIPQQHVEHAPEPDNRAHFLVFGPKGDRHPRIRLEFLRIARVVIPLSQE